MNDRHKLLLAAVLSLVVSMIGWTVVDNRDMHKVIHEYSKENSKNIKENRERLYEMERRLPLPTRE